VKVNNNNHALYQHTRKLNEIIILLCCNMDKLVGKFKKFFHEKKTDTHFKKSGPGHSISGGSQQSSSQRPQVCFILFITILNTFQRIARPADPNTTAAAALSRLQGPAKGGSSGTRSQQAIRAQVLLLSCLLLLVLLQLFICNYCYRHAPSLNVKRNRYHPIVYLQYNVRDWMNENSNIHLCSPCKVCTTRVHCWAMRLY
jgi:hypothetical protein